MRKAMIQAVLLIGVLALAACSSPSQAGPPATPTPQPLHVYFSTFSSTAANSVDALEGATGKLLWHKDTGIVENNPPVLDHGVVYVGSPQGVDALNAADGKLLWSHQTTGGSMSSNNVLAVVNGLVLVNSEVSASSDNVIGNGSIYALKTSDGSVRWNYQRGDAAVYGNLVADGVIYAEAYLNQPCHCSSQPRYHLALNASDGSVAWQTPQATDSYEAQAAANGLVYGLDGFTDTFTSTILARKRSDGLVAWQYPNDPSAAYVSLIGMNGSVVYVLSNDGVSGAPPLSSGLNVVYALKASDGSVIWRAQIADMNSTVPTLLDQVIYLGSSDGVVSALNTSDGKLIWHAQVGQAGTAIGSGTSIAAVVDGSVYLAFPQGFAALHVADGSLKWQYQASGALSVTAVTNGVVYASSRDSDTTNAGHNHIYALNASDGSVIWRYDPPTEFSAPVVG